ncbi:UdgX family uracil-DNA binding protein [Sphingomonas prati]|uniref:Type-4 uracil-DNA glycosylase n=1 Tax=Sphingomonas prati TaxID=1843237 RepID=A0A7W9BS27_9SPHN|nr:UdgX family uracil-DNA binding protein [Sphingomonas prati]MBB5729118.1 DNA polymerase [Sphingomonas prati]GGE84943.1 uracil-DNA glycosylase [Sphingomonas prati]
MRVATLASEDDFDGWRAAARTLALAQVAPHDVVWQVGERPADLFGDEASPDAAPGAFSVPRPFVDLARTALCHRDPERFALLYTLLIRVRAQQGLLDDRADPLVQRIELMAKDVRRDMHKMRAFVRFRELAVDGGETRYVAWFEPDNHIVRINADFFARRFATMHWSILTPGLSVHWDGTALAFAPGARKTDAPDGDPLEEMWKTYYAAIFNPARVKVGAMTKEMPRKYWKNMPETALIPDLLAGAQKRESGMIETAHADIGDNARAAWEALAGEAAGCTRCPLYGPATQTVFGEGPVDARLMFVGEQPGDQEDIAGRPFVGPAGQLFDRAIAAAGIDRTQVYVTNAVKHFKFEERGRRRIHAKPGAPEIDACRWWIDQERVLVRPAVTVALGVTAARSLLGKVVTISGTRGKPITLPDGGEAWITVHPSYLLRLPDKVQAEEEYARFVEDLKVAQARVTATA